MTERMPRSFRAGWGTLVLAGVLAAVVAPQVAHAQADPAQMEALWREGVDLYLQGRFTEAQRKLHQLLSMEPRKEMAARLVDEAGPRIVAQMMANPRMGNEPTYVWQLYRKYYVSKLADQERMAKMAARVVDPATSEDERVQLYREFGELGHYAIPTLSKYLNDQQHEDFRTQARIVLARMGSRAVLPLIELTRHPDVLMRENAVLTLTDIQPLDERAIPALKERLEDAKESETCKRLATRAIEQVTGLPTAQLKKASTYYYEAANKYYLERAGAADEAEEVDGFIWHLNEGGELIPVLYPLWAWNEQMAEDLALRGMSLEVDQTDFYPLAACIWAAQYMEVKDLVDVINEAPLQHYYSEEEKQQVLEWNQKLIDCRNLVSACGKYYVNAGLNKVYRDLKRYPGHGKLPGVGVFLAERLADLDPTGELLPPPPPPPVVAPAAPVAESPVLTSIAISPANAHVSPGQTRRFKATALDQFGKKIDGVAFRWTCEGGTIDESGVYTGRDPGGPYPVWAEALNPDGTIMGAQKAEATASVAPPPAPGEGPTRPAGSGSGLPEPIELDADPTPTSAALINGLTCNDQNIEYACALALARINRFPDAWQGSERVGSLLARGVSENQPIQILVVDEDHNSRNHMRTVLEAEGYLVTDAVDGRDGLIKARSFPPKDTILIATELRRDLTPEQLMEELRADVRTRYTPVGILHLTADRDPVRARYGTEIPTVEREMKGHDLKGAIEKIEQRRAAESIPKRKAHEISVACAQALSKLDIRATNIVLADGVKACAEALKNRKDDVRIPAATAIGQARGGDMKDAAAEALLGVFQDGQNATELRLAALKSLADVKPEAYADVYLKAQTEQEHVLQEWAAVNFGKHERTNKSLYEFLRSKRIDKDKKEK
ncbi:MAG: hypothetical protein AMXMBFR7_11410 [Planctomycetota bacterium]